MPNPKHLPDAPGLNRGRYANPANVVRSSCGMLSSLVSDGADRMRLVATVPHGPGVQWDWWARFENSANRIYAPFPLWHLCLYDLRTNSRPILDDVVRTHPWITAIDGHETNPRYELPDFVLRTRSTAAPDPVQLTEPMADLTDPSAAAARQAARTVARAAGLNAGDEEDRVIAVSETVSNGLVHGLPRPMPADLPPRCTSTCCGPATRRSRA